MQKYQFCFHCGKRLNTQKYSILYTGDGRYVCKSCRPSQTWECNRCESIFSNDMSPSLSPADETMCGDCWHEVYMHCGMCDSTFERRNGVNINTRHGRILVCRTCGAGRDVIGEYNFEPEFKFFPRRSKGGLFYGFEFEMECLARRHEVAGRIVKKSDGLFYCVRDGSLTHGIEIISNPASYSWIGKNFKYFREMFATKELGLTLSGETGTCGLHINMSREAFGAGHLFRFVKFMYRKGNRGLITRLSRRNKDTLQRWARLSYNGADIEDVVAGDTPEGHYYGVNLSNRRVVEVRIFNGTLEEDIFKASLEFCEALFHYTKPREATLTTKAFLNYVKKMTDSGGMYPNLIKFVDGGMESVSISSFEAPMLRAKLLALGDELRDG